MSAELNAEQIAAWLGERTDFFVEQPELLAKLRIPHPVGTVSLLEYQTQLLREENAKLREQLESACRNSQLFHALRKLMLATLAASDLDALLQAIQRGLREDFQVPQVSLMLFSDTPLPADCRQLPLKQAQKAINSLLKGGAQLCGALREKERAFLFGEQAEAVCSAAVIPLRGEYLYGLLALGSPDPQRYRGTQGSLFIDYLGEVLPCLLKRFLPT